MSSILVVVVFVVCCGLVSDAARVPDIFTHWRPSFQIYSNNQPPPLKLMKNGRFESIGDVADFSREALRRNLPEIHSTLEDALSSDDLVDVEPILGHQDYCTPLNSDVNTALGSLDQLDVIIYENNTRCTLCTGIFGILQTLACNADYDNLVYALIRLCEIIFSNTGVSNPTMCNGTITMQAPFVFTTLKESTPYDFCDTLNMCFPPAKQGQATVADRIEGMIYSGRSTKSRATGQDTYRHRRQSTSAEIKMLQLADIHHSTIYAEGSAIDCGMYVCCLEEFPGNGSARQYGEYACNIPERTMNHLLDEARLLGADFVIYTGDSPPHSIWDETVQSQLNCSMIVLKALKERLPGLTIFPAIGNHEMFPTNIYTMDSRYNGTKEMNYAFTELWKDVAGFGEEQIDTMQTMAYYTMLVPNHEKLRILTFNTNHYWYSLNFMAPLNRNRTEEEVQRQFIKDTLSAAESNGEKVIVVAHHPVASPDSTVRATRWWEETVLLYSDVIIMQLSGHTHSDEFHLFTDPENGAAKAINYVAPAFTSNTNVNPSLRLFHLDPDTYDVINFKNYYADIDTQQKDVPPPVVENYDVKQLYGMSDLTPQSWKDLSIRFVDDDELFQTWYSNKQAHAVDGQCTGDCKKSHICSMWFPNYDEVDACVDNWDDIIASNAHHVTPTVQCLIATLVALLCVLKPGNLLL